MVELTEITRIQAPIERCFDLARSVQAHLVRNLHFGESALATAGITSGLLNLGDQVTWRAKHFYVWHELTSQITAMDRPNHFQDAMVQGPFKMMTHDHLFRSIAASQTEMTDVFRFAAPLGILGRVVEAALLRRYMKNLLHERNQVIRQIAESNTWRNYILAKRTGPTLTPR